MEEDDEDEDEDEEEQHVGFANQNEQYNPLRNKNYW